MQVRKAKANQVTSSVGSLIEDLAGPPFGWSMTTVLVAIAHGFQNGILRLKLDSRSRVRTEIAAEMRNTAKQRLVLVEEIRAQDPAKIAQLQNFLNRYRDISTAPSNSDDLMRDVRSALREDLEALKEWAGLITPSTPRSNGHLPKWSRSLDPMRTIGTSTASRSHRKTAFAKRHSPRPCAGFPQRSAEIDC